MDNGSNKKPREWARLLYQRAPGMISSREYLRLSNDPKDEHKNFPSLLNSTYDSHRNTSSLSPVKPCSRHFRIQYPCNTSRCAHLLRQFQYILPLFQRCMSDEQVCPRAFWDTLQCPLLARHQARDYIRGQCVAHL